MDGRTLVVRFFIIKGGNRMADFNIDNLIINRALSGSMLNKATGEALYSLNQIKDPSLEITGETVYSVDAMGVKVAAFDRSKEASLSGSNAFVNLGLAAAQFGSDKKVATSAAKIVVPVRDTLVVDPSTKTATLKATPATGYTMSVSTMTVDGGINKTLAVADAAAAGKYKIADKVITIDESDMNADGETTLVVLYRKESTEAVQIDNRADCFAKGGEFWLEVLFCDPCDTSTEYHGFLVFPNAKMSNETTIDFNNEATHGFKIEAMQDYCSAEKKLFYLVVSK